MEMMDHDGPQGLAVSADGYTLVPSSVELTPDTTAPFTFRVIGKDGKPVKAYDSLHDKELHLIVVRRDLTGYQHLHPTRAASGTLERAPRRFVGWGLQGFRQLPAGRAAHADADDSRRRSDGIRPLQCRRTNHKPAVTSTVDGYRADLSGKVIVGGSKLTFRVTRPGKPVDLQPYLGAFGHLVAMRVGDLPYLHVHPEGTPGHEHHPPADGKIVFQAPVPTPGQYRLFLDFKVADLVRTAEFTVVAPRAK